MASSAAAQQAKDARVLAHKLFGQCRDLPGPYRSISSDIRKLRNVLEELEEALAEDTFDESQRAKALPSVANGRSVLSKLDLAVQSFRCAKDQQIDEHAVASFKKSLESATDELTNAYDTLTGSAEIAVRLVGRMSYDSAAAPPSIASAQNIRRQSQESSACSAATPHDVRTQSSQTDLSITSTMPNEQDRRPSSSDEKELYVAGHTTKLTKPSPTTRSPSSFSSPFANPDPMSMDFERASSLITAAEDHAISATISDAVDQGTGSSSDDVPVSAVRSDVDTAGADSVQPNISEARVVAAQSSRQTQYEVGNQLPSKTLERSEKTGGSPHDSTGFRKDSRLELTPQQDHESKVANDSELDAAQPVSQEISQALNPSDGERNMFSVTADMPTTGELEHIISPGKAMDLPVASRTRAELHNAISEPIRTNTGIISANDKQEDDDGVPLARLMSKRRRQTSELDQEKTKDTRPVRVAPETPPPRRSRQRSASQTPKEDLSLPPPSYNSLKPSGWQSRDSSNGKPQLQKQRSLSTSNLDDINSASKAARELFRGHAEEFSVETAGVLDLAMRPVCPVSETVGEPVSTFSPSPNSTSGTPEPHSPPQPRRPPPPPPSVSAPARVVQEKPSRYRITNPTLPPTTAIVEKPKDDDTDDELYTSSRRGSLTNPSQVPHIRVSIDTAPLKLDSMKQDGTIAVEDVDRNVHTSPSSPKLASLPALPPRPARSPASSPSTLPQGTLTASSTSMMKESTTSQNRARSISFEHDRTPSLKDYAKEVKASQSRRASAAPVLPRSDSTVAPQVNRAGSNHAPERSNSKTAPETLNARQQGPPGGVREFYTPERLHSSFGGIGIVDEERASVICVTWQLRDWDLAETYLQEHLVSMIEQDCIDGMRRVRHLLGVAASYKGAWATAIRHFLSVIGTRITDLSDIDAGTAAAAYWLGDVYALHNRRNEALVAYSIAAHSPIFIGREREHFREYIMFEQDTLKLSSPTQPSIWLIQFDSGERRDSILHPSVITKEAANKCLQYQPWSTRGSSYPFLEPGNKESRFRNLYLMRKSFNKVKLTKQELMVGGPWPFPYDPLFVMGSVHEGRLLAHECDMLQVFQTNPTAKVTRSGPLGLSRRECFTHNDLTWLIKATRSCLAACDLEWSEILNISGAWFCCRQKHLSDRFANFRYFSVAIFKKSFHSGYGLEVCPYGICTARYVPSELSTDSPESNDKMVKHWRRLIREVMESAATNGGTATGGARELYGSFFPTPPIPPRPGDTTVST